MSKSLFFFSLLGLFFVVFFALPALAQTTVPVWGVPGLGTYKNYGPPIGCPFGASLKDKGYDGATVGLDLLNRATKDPQGCPYASTGGKAMAEIGGTKGIEWQPLFGCKAFFENFAETYGPNILKDKPDSNLSATKMGCCYESSRGSVVNWWTGEYLSPRESCVVNRLHVMGMNQAYLGSYFKGIDEPQPNVNTKDDLDKAQKAKKDFADAQASCITDSLNRIGKFWAAKKAASCISNATQAATKEISKAIQEVKDSANRDVTAAMTGTMTYGAVTAVVSAPAAWSWANIGKTLANLAASLILVANEVSSFLNNTLGKCGIQVSGLSELQGFASAIRNGTCLPATNLLERQMTQCIRIDLKLDLSLPTFQVALQCPVNINISGHLSPQGFDCFSSATVQSPLTVYGSNVVSSNGGIEKLFDGACFKGTAGGNNTAANTTQASANGSALDGSGTRIPGVDCGPLSSEPYRQASIQGIKPLAAGRTSNGWAVGTTESVAGIPITRCDYYTLGRRGRTVYVYGDGASCNMNADGFLDNGFETNTACYSGGYQPATMNVPDACMYPSACLDTRGNFNEAFLGQQGCSTDVVPTFCGGKNPCPVPAAPCDLANPTSCNMATIAPMSVYPLVTSGGVNGGQTQYRSCIEFAGTFDPAPLCCDPSKQNCIPKSKGGTRPDNLPMCKCTQGDATNDLDPAITPNLEKVCKQGGNATCCSTKLNKSTDASKAGDAQAGCTSIGYGNDGICKDDVNQCTPIDAQATYVGPDGVTNKTFTAGQLATSKPSPYIYLFVRPDAELGGQACCTTEWCNVCPQAYVNAYGLALVRAVPQISTTPSDADNQNLIGKGWPYKEVANGALGAVTYTVGNAALPIIYQENPPWTFSNSMHDYALYKPDLHLSDTMKMPVDLGACNRVSKGLIASKQPSGNFANGYAMGWTHDAEPKKSRIDWRTYSGVPEPTEYPMDYMNRLRQNVLDSNGVPLPAIGLCNDVKLCLPGSGQAPTSGGSLDSGGANTGGGGATDVTPVDPNAGGGTGTGGGATTDPGTGGGGGSGGGGATIDQPAVQVAPQSTGGTTQTTQSPGLF
jgi:hypothetical protein